MSEAAPARIAVLQHKRRQDAFREELTAISNSLLELHHDPLDAAVSVQLQSNLYAKLKDLRARGGLRQHVFADAESAVGAALERIKVLRPTVVFEVYAGASGSGFFAGSASSKFLKSCLRHGYEGVAVVLQSLDAGVVLDVVLDDPVRGDCYEVEWW